MHPEKGRVRIQHAARQPASFKPKPSRKADLLAPWSWPSGLLNSEEGEKKQSVLFKPPRL